MACNDQGGNPASNLTPAASQANTGIVAHVSVSIDSTQPEPTPVPPMTLVRVFPKDITVAPGQSAIFTATAFDASGRVASNVRMEWRVVAPEVGTITPDGLFEAGSTPGVYPFSVEVTAVQANGGQERRTTETTSVAIARDSVQRQLSNVTIYPTQITVRPGQFVGLGALSWDAQGQSIPQIDMQWSVASQAVGTIDRLGFFQASSNTGDYPNAIKVTATQDTPDGRITREAFASVVIRQGATAGVLSYVVIIPNNVTLFAGQQTAFTARAFDGSGQALQDVRIQWTLPQSSLGQLSNSGQFIAGARLGAYPEAIQVTATQTSKGNLVAKSAAASISIQSPPATRLPAFVQISPKVLTLKIGDRAVFSALALDEAGMPVAGTKTTWDVEGAGAGSIDAHGLFKAGSSPGTYLDTVKVTMSQTTPQGVKTLESYATVRILGPLVRVEVQPSSVTSRPGSSLLLRVVGYDANGLPVPGLRVKWRILNKKAGQIDSTGLFTAGKDPGDYADAIEAVVSDLQ